MTTIQLIGAGVLVIGILVGVIVWVSRSSGRSIAERNALQDGEKRRGKFDEEASKRAARGRELISRLRDMGR